MRHLPARPLGLLSTRCSISLRYDSGQGVYEMQQMTLAAGEMRVINLKRLQAERIPGVNGEILPKSAAFGGMKFVEEPGGKRFLVEGGVFNPRTGTCGVCGFGCLYPLSLITIPGGMAVVVGELSGALGVQANMCDGTHQLGWQCSCDFASDNTAIATINPFCTHYVTGTNPGSTFTNGTAVDVPGPHCGEQTLIARCNVDVRPRISGPVTLWWFNNYSPSGYATQITLTATPANAGSYQWAVVAGTSFVDFSNNSDNMTTATNQVALRSTGQSINRLDISIRVTVNNVASFEFPLTSKAPYSLTFVREDDQADGTRAYSTFIHYQIKDQLGDVLPSIVPASEFFTTPVIPDYPGQNWTGGPPVSAIVNPADFVDHIAPGASLSLVPAPRPPCIPLCDVKVNHNDGSFHVGTTNPGQGLRVQTHTWQFYTDHGEHRNRVSPAPL